MNLKNKIIIASTFLVFLGIGLKKIVDYQDYNPTVIVETNKFQNQKNKDLLKGDSVSSEFVAKNNNLGIISILFNTHGRINDDYLEFSIKEYGSDNWYYTNKYKVDQFKNYQYFPFGFPEINASKGKKYQIKIESLCGSEGNLVMAVVEDKPFLAKYSFPKAYLLRNIKQIPMFVISKVVSFFEHININVYLLVLGLSFILFFVLGSINDKEIELFLTRGKKFFLIRYLNKFKTYFNNRILVKILNIVIIFLIAIFSTFILYGIFFAFSKVIWSMNLNVDLNTLTSSAYSWVVSPGQRDGIETFVLYVLTFICIALTIIFVWLYELLKRSNSRILGLFVLVFTAYFYYSKIGFFPPMLNKAPGFTPFILMLGVMFITWLLIKVASWKEWVANVLIIILLVPICFIATSPISSTDYSYIFAPALRIINSIQLKDIYFQYDLLLSLIAVLWMKLKIDLNLFQVLGQASFYILFLATFFFSKKLFVKKQLAYYLLISVILVKIYGLICDPILVFQVTPLRLDWWLLVLIISFNKGIYNNLLGIILGLLIIFHRTFGLIYTIGYLQVIIMLFLFEFLNNKISLKSFRIKIKKHFYLCLPNFVFLIFSFIVSLVLFGRTSLEAASIYQKIGIGFMTISQKSFYWYYFVLVSAVMIILIKKRKRLSTDYLNSSLFLITLSIGNSIYFFGRSHENNIINISASLIFVLYLLFDLILDFRTKGRKLLSVMFPLIFILIITYYYSAGILDRSQIQFHSFQKGQVIYPISIDMATLDIDIVKKLTNNSDKVYFTGDSDFYFYYYGNYVPQGRYSPYLSWVYKSDMINFMQNLLNVGYYIVSPPRMYDEGLFSKLVFNKSATQNGFKVVWYSDN